MGFELFNKPGERFSTKISVWKQGVIHLSKGTMNSFALNGLSFCTLYFDREQNRVGLQFSGTAREGSVKLSFRDAGAVLPAKSFFDYYGISYAPSRQYRLELDRQSGLLVFELAQPVEEYQEHPDGSYLETTVRSVRTALNARNWHLPPGEEAKLVRYLFEAGNHCNWDELAMEENLNRLLDAKGGDSVVMEETMAPQHIVDVVQRLQKNNEDGRERESHA